MPRYYFHIKPGQVIVLDHEGARTCRSRRSGRRSGATRTRNRRARPLY